MRLGWGAEKRKEIELRSQKIKIGNLPTANSGLKTTPDLRSKTSPWISKSAVFTTWALFVFVYRV